MNNTFVITPCVFKHLCLNWLAFFFFLNVFAFASKLKLTPVETQQSQDRACQASGPAETYS